MSIQKAHGSMDKLDKYYNVVRQNSARNGINTVDIAKKLGVHRTTAYDYLNSLERMRKIKNEYGRWFVTTGDQEIKQLEKEIVIELPTPKNQWRDIARVETAAKYLEDLDLAKSAEMLRILVDKFNETRIIKIKSKNIDDLDLEKLANLIQQATEKASKFNLKRIVRSLRKSDTFKTSKSQAREKTNG